MTVTAAMRTTVRAAVRAAWDSVVWYVTQAILVVVEAVRENRVVVVSADAVMTQRIQVVVAQAVGWVMTQRITRVHVCAVAAFGSKAGGRTGQFILRIRFLLARVGDECQKGHKKQGLFHELVNRMM